MKASPRVVLATVALLALSVAGCYSKATAFDGKFTFAYAAGLQFENFGKPIAPGAKLDVVAFANGTEDKLVITSAKSSQPRVLAVEAVREHVLVLKGGEPGVADIEITARDASGKTLVDRMFLHVAKPAVHDISHACTDKNDAIYVRGQDVAIYHGLATSDGRPVIGYGYMPLEIDPSPSLELVAQPQDANVYMFRGRAAGKSPVTIRSTVDGGALSLRMVERGELKEATLDCYDDCRVLEGGARYVVARVRMGETPVCSQNALTKARSLTPQICSVTAKLDDDDGTETNHEQLAVVTGLKFGVCKYEVTLPELDGGKGLRLTGEARIGRIEFPGGGKEALAPAPPPSPAPDGAYAAPARIARRAAKAWALVGLGWLAPNLLALACIGWVLRRRRRTATSPPPAAE